jgi:CHAD domain-containing protein
MAKAEPIPGLAPELPFRQAAAAAVEVRTGELFAHSENVLDTDDIERVHDMRVASRRLRAVLEIFAECFPKPQHRAVLREVKALADALGERRDPDVMIALLERVADGLDEADRPGIASLEDAFREGQQSGNERLEQQLREIEAAALRERLLVLAAEARAV